MNLKTTLLAIVVGFGALTSANVATAAPLAPATVAVEAAAGTEAIGYKRYGKRFHGKRFSTKRYAYRPYHVKCFKKKIRVRAHYGYGWTYKFKKVCKRVYH